MTGSMARKLAWPPPPPVGCGARAPRRDSRIGNLRRTEMSASTATTRVFESINPATEEVIASFDYFTSEQTEQALAEADVAFRRWRETSRTERAAAMRRAAGLLRTRKDRYAGLITAEMGKPIAQAEAEARQHRRPEARIQCAAVRARRRGGVP